MMNEEEEDICRVCRNGSTPDNQLSYPCKCSGSIKFIHQNCLLEWIKHSKSSSCELCGYPFRFTPIYSDNTPDILPLKELTTEVIKRSFKFLKRFARITFSFICFLVMIPAFTVISFHLFFGVSSKKVMPYTIFNSFLIGITLYFFIIAASFLSYIFLSYLNGKLIEMDIEEPSALDEVEEEEDDDEEDDDDEEVYDEDDLDFNEEDLLQDDVLYNQGVNFVEPPPQQPQQHQQPVPQPPQQQQIPIFRIPGVIEILGVQQQEPQIQNPDVLLNNLENNNIIVNDEDGDDIETLIGLRGPISDVILRTASFAVYNFVFLSIFLYLPFQIGKQVILMISQIDIGIGGIQFSKLTEGVINLFVGYMSLSLFSLFILSQLVKHKIAYKISRLLHSFIKIAMVVFIELGIIPLMFGIILDFLTLSLFGGTIESRMETFTNNKIQYTLTRLVFGLLSIIAISSSSRVLHQIFRAEVIWFLKDSADPDFSLVKFMIKAKLYQIFINISVAFITYVMIGVLIVFLPLKVLSYIPNLLPMDFGDIFNKLGTDICLIVSTTYFPRFHPQFTFNTFIKTTFTYFITKLGLDDYMLIRKPTTEANLNGVQNNNNNNNNNNQPDQHSGQPQQQQHPEQYIKPEYYGYKVLFFIFLCWLELFCASILTLGVPVSIGRYLFNLIQFTYHNDTVSLFVGLGVLWIITKIISLLFSGRESIQIVFSKLPSVLKLAFLSVVITVCLPLLTGLVFELVVIIPLVANYDESYYIFVIDLFNIWGIGVLLLNFWYQWVTSRAPINNIRNRRPPEDELIPHQEQEEQDNSDRWIDRFNQLKRNGVMGIDLWFSLQKIVFPIIHFLLKLLTIPYFIAKGVIPLFGGSPLLENITFLYGYPVFVLILVTETLYTKIKKSIIHFHNIIRDDRYLIGKHLHNLEQHQQQQVI